MENGPVFFRHGRCHRLLLTLLVEKAPVEGLLRARRFGLQTIQDFLVLEHFGALRHGAFLDNVIDPVQDRIGGEFSFREPEQGLHLLGKPCYRGRQRRTLFVEILFLPMEHVAQQPGCFVIEIVACGHHIVLLLDRHAVELVAFDGPARGTGWAMDEHGQFFDPCASLLLDCVKVQFSSM
ncbi:MAG: hypothetical protein JW395_3137 [Nitrospira sp.]|nr:hypothetical protein [Nitrospira sp.]